MEGLNFYKLLYVYNTKKKGQVFYEQFLNICFFASNSLDKLYLEPLIETLLGKHCRLQNNLNNDNRFFLSLKKRLEKNRNKDLWFLKIKIFCLWNMKTKNWLLKNMIIDKKFFEKLFSLRKISSYKLNDSYLDANYSNIFFQNIFELLINYMLNDLVCFNKISKFRNHLK